MTLDTQQPKALWASRFEHGMTEQTLVYTETTAIDDRMIEHDLWGSLVHVLMLAKQGIIGQDDARRIVRWLLPQHELATRGELTLDPALEDVHLNIEARLIDAIGLETGGRMHTARSRNDQVVTDARLYVRERVLDIAREILDFVDELSAAADEEVDTVLLGYTHSQPAQPISYGFWLAAHACCFLRDVSRHLDAFDRVNENPLGACALAGTSFDIDRHFTTRLLGFSEPMTNALDATSTRDFMLETSGVITILMSNISRFADEVVTWCAHEYGLLDVHESFATGSSIMPQKRNPVVAELARAKGGIALGAFSELYTVLKSVKLGYSCDLQQDKPPLWRAIDVALSTTRILRDQLVTSRIEKERGEELCWESFSTATELANELVRGQGVAFRHAYGVVGEIVRALSSEGLTLEDSGRVGDLLREKGIDLDPETIREVTDPQRVLRNATSLGGTAPDAVRAGVRDLRERSAARRKEIDRRSERIDEGRRTSLLAASRFSSGEDLAAVIEDLELETGQEVP